MTDQEYQKIKDYQASITNMFKSLKGGLVKPCGEAGCGIKWDADKGTFEGSCRRSKGNVCQYADLSRKFKISMLPACQKMLLAKWKKQEEESNLAEFLAGGNE